jgi:hypothetical protein
MASGTSNDLMDVWGSSASEVLAVGASGTILHFDGTEWASTESGTTMALNAVWGSSPDDVSAVGQSGFLARGLEPYPFRGDNERRSGADLHGQLSGL